MSSPTTGSWWPRPSNDQYSIHNRIMLSAALSLAAVVVVVIALHLYFRYVLRRQQLRRRSQTSALQGADAPASPEPPNAGLHPSVISSLPTLSYKRHAADPAGGDGAASAATVECAVCLCSLEEGEVARLLPNCGHLFHVGCIDMWLASHSTCPICRAEAEPKPVAAAAVTAQLPRPSSSDGVEVVSSAEAAAAEDTSGSCKDQEGATSRLNASLRRMLSLGRSQRRVQTDGAEDLEWQ